MALNYIWIAFFLVGFIVAIVKSLFLGESGLMNDMMNGMFDSAKTGFEISIGLTGIMTLWLGLMKVGEKAGVISIFSKGVTPFFKTLFPGVPKGHKAQGSIMMNFSANMLGLDNAATPLGLKAMENLQELNSEKEKASNAQIMFLVLNTAGVTLIPTSVIAIRQAVALEQGVANFNAADIFLPTLIVTFISFVAGMIAVAIVQKINLFKLPVLLFVGGFGGIIALLYYTLSKMPPEQMSSTIGLIGSSVIMLIVVLFIVAGALKKQNVYDNFIDGAKEGFTVAIRIIPYLIAMLIAISVFRTSGCMQYMVDAIGATVAFCGLPTHFVADLPMALMKPLSGSGARGMMVDVMNTYGVASFQGKLAAILQGSTETTFYVLAVYFGSVGVKNPRYALVCGLIADLVSVIVAIIVAYAFFAADIPS
ncbi:MAG: nucleoside recognition domain-containing protein [Flavipsychrobacter sp.]